jgi:hypothetical protein
VALEALDAAPRSWTDLYSSLTEIRERPLVGVAFVGKTVTGGLATGKKHTRRSSESPGAGFWIDAPLRILPRACHLMLGQA